MANKRYTFQYIYKFLSSVKLAIYLLIIIAITSIIGTIIPQKLPFAEYAHRFGKIFGIIKILKLNDFYHSPLFVLLLALFSLNLILCTLNRLIPTFRIFLNPKIILKEKAMKSLNPKAKFTLKGDFSKNLSNISKILNLYNYGTRERKEGKKIHYFASKGVVGRFGADLVHISILIIAMGAIIGGIKGYREDVSLSVGSKMKLPNENFSIRVDDFKTEYYPSGQVKDWKSTLTIIDEYEEKLTKTIEVNYPLTYKGVRFYQSSYGWDWEKTLLTINIEERKNKKFIDSVEVKVGDKFSIPGKDLDIYILDFVPDFIMDENKKVYSRSNQPNNPAILLEGRKNEETKFIEWVFALLPEVHFSAESEYKFELIDYQAPQYTGLLIVRDPGVFFIWVGCVLGMLGIIASFYIFYRQIWLTIDIKEDSTLVSIGGTTKKSKSQFNNEFNRIVKKLKGG